MHRFRTKNSKIFLENVPAQVGTPKGRDILTIPSPVEFVNFFRIYYVGCASGCVVECWICNWAVAGSNLGLGYFAPWSVYSAFHPSGVGK